MGALFPFFLDFSLDFFSMGVSYRRTIQFSDMTTVTIDTPVNLPKLSFKTPEEFIAAYLSLGGNAEMVEDFLLAMQMLEASKGEPTLPLESFLATCASK